MKQNNTTTLTRINKETLEKAKKEARRRGISATKLLTDCVDHYLVEVPVQ
jgi:hypothetical protein